MANFVNYFKRANWIYVHREQLASVARTTPAAMVGYAANTGVAICAFWGVIPDTQLIVWAICSLGLSGYVGMRAVLGRRIRSACDDSLQLRSSRSALVLGFLLALPWTVLATNWAGHVPSSSEVVLIALSVGMAASGSVLLAPIPVAAAIYVSTILVPLILKCLFVLAGQHIVLGALAISFLVFLLGLIATNARLFLERLNAVNQLKESVKALSEAREEVERVAMTDGLTGVANNRAFRARLNSLNAPSEQAPTYSLFYLDLDRFKYVNDALGHAVGDALLKAAARRIENCLRKTDFVARIGGDEFAIIAQNVSDPASASTIADSLVTKLAEPFQLNGQTIQIGASIGVAMALGSHVDGGQLLQQADLAMYAAKCAGQGGYCIFEPDMQRLAEERRDIEIGLGSAIANGEFALLYQPIREMATGSITGMECLIRWHHPTRGQLLPAHFLHVAEDIGMANEIGAWVIEEACRQAVKWPSDVVVGVNLSPLQIASGDVMGPIERALKSSGLPARRLELEITETSLLQSNPDTIESFRRLKEMGISIALDDFGTGFSSLGYLVNFPFNRIKIDRLFVSQLGSSRQSDLIVKSVAQLAKNLKCSVVAEGIETAEQHRRLRAFNVSHGQGFYLGRPVSAREALKLLAADNAHALAESA